MPFALFNLFANCQLFTPALASPRVGQITMGIAGRCRRCCAVVEQVGDGFLRHAGPFYVALGCSLVAMVAYSLLFVVLPLTKDLHSWRGACTFAGVSFVFVNIGFNYLLAVRVDPGSPVTRDVQVLCAEAGAAVRRWCAKCKCPKPALTHHCSVCKRCVLKMDHHCPWIHNCVGHGNYRYFHNFLFWLWVGCLVTVWHTGGAAVGGPRGISVFGLGKIGGGMHQVNHPASTHQADRRAGSTGITGAVPESRFGGDNEEPYPHQTPKFTPDERSAALFSCLLAVSVFLAMCGLWWWHVYLVLTAQVRVVFPKS